MPQTTDQCCFIGWMLVFHWPRVLSWNGLYLLHLPSQFVLIKGYKQHIGDTEFMKVIMRCHFKLTHRFFWKIQIQCALISEFRLLCITYIKYFKEGRFEADICTVRKILSPPWVTRFSLFFRKTQSTDDWSNEYYTIHFQLFGKSHLMRKAFDMINLIPLFPFVSFRIHLTMTYKNSSFLYLYR